MFITEEYDSYFNEVVIMLTLYSFLCFTDFVTEPIFQYKMGFLASFLVCAHLVVNLVLIISITLIRLNRLAKYFYLKRKLLKAK